MANETKKQADDDLFKALALGTLRDDDRVGGSPRNPKWKKLKKAQRKDK